MVRLRSIVTAVLAAALAGLLHTLAFQLLAASPPALRAFGPAGEAWNRAALAAAQLACGAWLGHRAIWRRRMERLESNRDPWAGVGLQFAAYTCVMLASATLARIPAAFLQELEVVGLAAAAALVQVLPHIFGRPFGPSREIFMASHHG